MILLTGPSASGKTATCFYLQSHYGIKKVVTHTTRQMRVGETNDVDYHFVSVEEFLRMKDNDEFIETVFYNGNYYGTSKKEVGIDKGLVVELEGAKTYRKLNDPKTVIFYMEADENIRKERMLGRGDEPEKVKSRLVNDKTAFELGDEFDKLVDVKVDTMSHDLEEVAGFIYKKYYEILKERGIEF